MEFSIDYDALEHLEKRFGPRIRAVLAEHPEDNARMTQIMAEVGKLVDQIRLMQCDYDSPLCQRMRSLSAEHDAIRHRLFGHFLPGTTNGDA